MYVTRIPDTLHPIGIYALPEWKNEFIFTVVDNKLTYEQKLNGVTINTGITMVESFSIKFPSEVKDKIKFIKSNS